jgi:sugar (pentulose or hexulose) kinase
MSSATGSEQIADGDFITLILNATDLRVDVHTSRDVQIKDVPVMSHSVADEGSVDDPRSWTRALVALLERQDFGAVSLRESSLIVRASEIGMVCLAANGETVYPILWAHDQRSHDDAMWCRKKHDDDWWIKEVGLVPQAHHLVTKMSWLHRSEPDIWDNVRRICSLEDYVIEAVVRDSFPDLVSGTSIRSRPELLSQLGVWSAHTNTYSPAVLSLIDSQKDWTGVMPEVCAAGTRLGSQSDRRFLL